MKRIGYWREFEDSKEDLPWPTEGRLPSETKQELGKYLMEGKLYEEWKGSSRCRICGKANGSTCLINGDFIYPEGYSHYILEHNISPDLDLLAVVLERELSKEKV
jgi:hypothetical protein